MPYHKSCKKRILTSKKQNLSNRMLNSKMHTAIKRVLDSKTKDEGEKALKEAVSTIDKSVKKNIIHRNNASNKKSRLSKIVQKLKG